MKRMIATAVVGAGLFIAQAVYAMTPTETIKHMTASMITALKNHQSDLKKPGVIEKIVDKELLPHVNVNNMAGRVVGRQAWMSATPAVRTAFIGNFKKEVVETYSSALASFDDDKVHVYPLRQAPTKVASVRTNIIRKSGQRILMIYNMRKVGSAWKIYDVSIENVSIVDNYKEQYASTIDQGGLSYLNQQLMKRRG